jgi:hypothetical protein
VSGTSTGWSGRSVSAPFRSGAANHSSACLRGSPGRNTFSANMVRSATVCPFWSTALSVVLRCHGDRPSAGPTYSVHAAGPVQVVLRWARLPGTGG